MTKERKPLAYRVEALAANHAENRPYGSILLALPPGSRVVVMVISGCVAAFIILLSVAGYTRRTTVSGELTSIAGVMKIVSPMTGVITHSYVGDGQKVSKDDPLVVVSTDDADMALNKGQAFVTSTINLQIANIQRSIETTRRLRDQESRALSETIQFMDKDIEAIRSQVDVSERKVKLAQEFVKRYEEIFSLGYVAEDQLKAKVSDSLEQQLRMKDLNRILSAKILEVREKRGKSVSDQLRYSMEISDLERQIGGLQQALADSEMKRSKSLYAPRAGVVSAANAEVGRTVKAGEQILSIVPDKGELQAYLYAASSAVGTVKRGTPVAIRYQSFPYQKFGQAKGVVVAVSQSATGLSDISMLKTLKTLGKDNSNEPVFRITVTLNSQKVRGFPLQAGMLLEADILQEKRKLIEWIFEPLYGFTNSR